MCVCVFCLKAPLDSLDEIYLHLNDFDILQYYSYNHNIYIYFSFYYLYSMFSFSTVVL